MQSGLGELSDLYGSLSVGGSEGGESTTSLETIMRINSFLNNSLDLHNIVPDTSSRHSIDLMLSELMSNTGGSPLMNWKGHQPAPRPVTSAGPKKPLQLQQNLGGGGGCGGDPSIPLSRLLAQTYSYSSESSSPNSSLTPHSTSQGYGHNNSVFGYMDDSPQSSGSTNSRQSFSYSQSPGSVGCRMKQSSSSDPGSPTLGEAILMGCQDVSPNTHDVGGKVTDAVTLANLVSSLSLGGCNRGPGHLSTEGVSRSSAVVPNNSLMCTSGLQVSNNNALLGMQPHQGQQQLQEQSSNLRQLSLGLNSGSVYPTPPLPHGLDMNGLAQLQSAWLTAQRLPSLAGPGLQGSELNKSPGTLTGLLSTPADTFHIEKAAKMHRNAAAVCDANCTWSGQLPVKVHKNPTYSCKVFLGGVPWDLTELTLKQTFSSFGEIQVEWPGKKSSINPPKGYIYVIFEDDKQVKALLAACSQDFTFGGNHYYKISSRRIRQKEVQIIPWIISDSNYVRCPSYQLDPAKTVFVGALHGTLSAEGLASIMNDLFGGVVYSGIDTDKHKYPIGSGRVTFNNEYSYKKAVRAAFIEIKTPKFTKKVQVDPYLADSLCQVCGLQQGPYFCREEVCFKYFCRSCWQENHPIESHSGHKPIMRNSKLRTQNSNSHLI
ncbi:cytoplasmic polyadenylation element-binding protein 1-like isoform X2 [Portunus trituberculatus]|uniref:cytoplasmic polyadenylation element-binding protein 1-like isoform X2 n=1 Tax=Portunus trituberculatus TaxID=210409 RepID=UPI001E1CED4C|nr:cytoplasmic polyadenylation element-binding protein 1-like isoform X2 [Portunus trituberculatus]